MEEIKGPGQNPTPKTDPAFSWGMLCHLTALSLFLGIPFGNLIGPLIVWLLKKDEMPFVEDQGKESLNFQITVTILGAIATLLCFILIGIPILFAIGVIDIILVIVATVRSYKGEAYRYPFSFKFLK